MSLRKSQCSSQAHTEPDHDLHARDQDAQPSRVTSLNVLEMFVSTNTP